MICKWCGNKMSPSDTKCKRCGKEVPALSDCGGFYDIISKEPKPAEVSPAPVVSMPEQYMPATESAPVSTSNDNKKVKLILAGCVLAVIIALLVSVIALMAKVGELEDKLDEAKESGSISVEEEDEEKDTGKKPAKDDENTTKNTEKTTKYESANNDQTEPQVPPKGPIFEIDDPDNVTIITLKLKGKSKDFSDDENLKKVVKWLKTIEYGDVVASDEASETDTVTIKYKDTDNQSVSKTLEVKSTLNGKSFFYKDDEKLYKLNYDDIPDCVEDMISDED